VETWQRALNADPLPWLLDEGVPAVRQAALRWLLDEAEDSRKVRLARASAMRSDPIATILSRQHSEGFWVKPGPGYSPKYTGTVWSLIFLDQLGADGRDRRVRLACDYVLSHAQAKNGGFGWQGSPATVVHCLNGNLLSALIGFGGLGDERVRAALDWQARSVTGEGFDDFHPWSTSGPGFRCGINGDLPCAWGAIKALRALARVPARRRSAIARRAITQGTELLLSRDPAVADYPTNSRVSPNWLKLGFPSGYVADVLQNLEVLAELGHGKDARLSNAIDLVLSKQDASGRWRNEYPYRGKTWVDFEPRGGPSRWVTLRACRVLRAALG
jgi:hypothetical protein